MYEQKIIVFVWLNNYIKLTRFPSYLLLPTNLIYIKLACSLLLGYLLLLVIIITRVIVSQNILVKCSSTSTNLAINSSENVSLLIYREPVKIQNRRILIFQREKVIFMRISSKSTSKPCTLIATVPSQYNRKSSDSQHWRKLAAV